MSITKFDVNTAFHESAHAVVAVMVGITVNSVSIQKATGELGSCDFSFKRPMHNNLIAAALAGGILEQEAGGLHWVSCGELISAEDWRVIDDACFYLGIRGEAEKQQHIQEIWCETEKLLSRKDVRRAIGDVARELLERMELDGNEVMTIVKRHLSI